MKKKVGLYDKEGKFVSSCLSVSEAAKFLNTTQPNISAALKSGGSRSGYFLRLVDKTGRFPMFIDVKSRPKKGRNLEYRIVISRNKNREKKVFFDYDSASEFLECDIQYLYSLTSTVKTVKDWLVYKFQGEEVCKLDLLGKVIKEYTNREEAEKAENISSETFTSLLTGKDNLETLHKATVKNENTDFKHYRWRYKEDILQAFPYDDFLAPESIRLATLTNKGKIATVITDLSDLVRIFGKYLELPKLLDNNPYIKDVNNLKMTE